MFDPFSFQTVDAVPALEQLAGRLPDLMHNVTSLNLIHHQFVDISRLESAANALANITHLRLCCAGGSLLADNMLHFVSLLRRLEGLEFRSHGHHAEISNANFIAPSPPPRHLKYLTLGRGFCYGPTMSWLQSGTTTVDDLRITSWMYQWDTLLPFLVKIQDGLKSLMLRESALTSQDGVLPCSARYQSTDSDQRARDASPALRTVIQLPAASGNDVVFLHS